jgi:hypothetical protein
MPDSTHSPQPSPWRPSVRLGIAVVGVFLISLFVAALAQSQVSGETQASPTITSDKPDYAPGEVVTLTGTGWLASEPVEPVHIVVNDDAGQTWSHVADVTPKSDGSISDSFTLPNWFVASYSVTATQGTLSATTSFTDAAASLAQCTNGGVGDPPEPCKGSNGSEIDGFKNWENGNANGSKAHWREGEFISYRDTIAIDAAGTHVFRIQYDTVHSGTHALDYLGSFDATETTSSTPTTFHANNNNPCADKLPAADCTPSAPDDSFAVPPAALTNCATSTGTPPATQIPGSFKIWGTNSPDIQNASYPSGGQNVVSGTGQCTTSVDITFTTGGAGTVVLAWGGHIASEAEWGAGNSATFISGSPYHMAQVSLTSNGANQPGVGSQDRALATSAVVFTPSINTVIKDSQGITVPGDPPTVTPGTTVHDTAALTGASSNAGGTVTYKRFTTIDCTGPSTDQNVTVTNGIVPNSQDFTPLTAGGYSYQAVYSGTNGPPQNLGATSPCEPLRVTAVAPTVTTTIHNAAHEAVTAVALGSTVHDSVAVTGSAGTATGNVTFDFFNSGDCSGDPAATSGSFALSSGSVDATTFTQGPLAAGSYSFKAHYGGGGNYAAGDSDCEPLTVGKADSSTATTIHNAAHEAVTQVALGSTVHDQANVSSTNTSFDPSGDVTFTFWRGAADCEAGDSEAAGVVSVDSDGVAHPSDSKGPLQAGDYAFRASYAGDANFNDSTSDCEPLTVGKATPGIATIVKDSAGNTVDNNNPAAAGITAVHDTATLSGQVGSFSLDGTATVTYSFFNNNACTGTPASTENKTVSALGLVPDSSAQILGAGSYSYQATYNGNANYAQATGACEPFRMVPPTGKITPTQTTCEQFRDGTNGDLTDEFYLARANKIVSIAPGVFFYYSKITAPASSFTIEVKQSQTLNWKTIGTMQLILWDANCIKTAVTGSSNNGTVTFNATGLTAGATYYVSVKYDPTTLVGQAVPGKPTNVYSFLTWINGSPVLTSPDAINVKPK